MPPLGVPTVQKRARKPASRPAKRRKTAAPQPVEVKPNSFESQLRETQLEHAIEAPINGGSEAAVATTIHDDNTSDGGFDEDQMDDFDGIDWLRLPLYCKPLASQTARKSWVYRHGYRVTSLASKGKLVYFVCRYCHSRRYIDASCSGIYETTRSTSTAAHHLESNRAGHGHVAPGKAAREALTDSSWLWQAFKSGFKVTVRSQAKDSRKAKVEQGEFDEELSEQEGRLSL
jgi:hypothetical protein